MIGGSWKRCVGILAFTAVFLMSSTRHIVLADIDTNAGPEHIIVLMDTSESMQGNDQQRRAIDWTRWIGALCKDSGINLSIYMFNEKAQDENSIEENVQIFLDNQKVDTASLSEMNARLDEVQYKGMTTDPLGALKMVNNSLLDERMQNSSIIILSDGDLDYEGRKKGDLVKVPLTLEEKAAIADFQNICVNLGERGCNVFLVAFVNEVGMFKDLEGKKGITYLYQDSDMSEITKRIFAQSDYQVDKTGGKLDGGGTLNFSLDYNCSRVIINIKKGKEETPQIPQVYYYDEEKEVPYEVVDLAESLFVYLYDLDAGMYEIRGLGDASADYIMMLQKKYEEFNFDVELYDELKNKIKRNASGIYEIKKDMIPVTVRFIMKENVDQKDITSFYYQIDDNKARNNILWNGQTVYDQVLNLPSDSEKHNYTVLCDVGGKIISNIFSIQCEVTETSVSEAESEEMEVYINVKIGLINDKISREGYSEENIKISVNGLNAEVNSKTETYELNRELEIAFAESGEYVVEVYRNGEVKRKIVCTVKKNPMTNIIRGGGAVFVIVILLSVCLAMLKKRN